MSASKAGDLVTVQEAAKLLKISPVTIKRWLKQGRLRAYHVGPRAVRIKQEDIDALLMPTTALTHVTDQTTDHKTEHTKHKEVSTSMPHTYEQNQTHQTHQPQAAELARRRRLVAAIRARREQRVIAPMTTAQLIQISREEAHEDRGGKADGDGEQEHGHAAE